MGGSQSEPKIVPENTHIAEVAVRNRAEFKDVDVRVSNRIVENIISVCFEETVADNLDVEITNISIVGKTEASFELTSKIDKKIRQTKQISSAFVKNEIQKIAKELLNKITAANTGTNNVNTAQRNETKRETNLWDSVLDIFKPAITSRPANHVSTRLNSDSAVSHLSKVISEEFALDRFVTNLNTHFETISTTRFRVDNVSLVSSKGPARFVFNTSQVFNYLSEQIGTLNVATELLQNVSRRGIVVLDSVSTQILESVTEQKQKRDEKSETLTQFFEGFVNAATGPFKVAFICGAIVCGLCLVIFLAFMLLPQNSRSTFDADDILIFDEKQQQQQQQQGAAIDDDAMLLA